MIILTLNTIRLAKFALLAIWLFRRSFGLFYPVEMDEGSLSGDVQNWAELIQNYITELANNGIRRDDTQSYFDTAEYIFENKSGEQIVDDVKEILEDYFTKKMRSAHYLAERIRLAYDRSVNSSFTYVPLADLDNRTYRDSDIPSRLPRPMAFSPYFKQPVNMNASAVKIADEVPRHHEDIVRTVLYTYELEDTFIRNSLADSELRWQYFGTAVGVLRLFPGREWDTNFAGFYNDYDPRVRPWYIAATSGPKDVVIILDCSLSMRGKKFEIAQAVAKTVIDTLTRQDYVNVICARASHWDEIGKWHFYSTEALSCQQDQLVPATVAHRKDLKEKVSELKAGGTSEFEKAYDMTFNLLRSKQRTGCQSIVVFVTDGKDTDGEPVRCGSGYYTRSGYVPGPICKYNWTKVWSLVEDQNAQTVPSARIFTYLTIDDGEIFPGKLACDHRGSMRKLTNGENLLYEMGNYFEFLSGNTKPADRGLWTSPYIDAFGMGVLITYAVPVVSDVNGKTIGVVGIDTPLDDIENILTRYQWGDVYSFLVSRSGETIFHPKLKQSSNLVDDPIFIPIQQLEQNKAGQPKEFTEIYQDMLDGKTGSRMIQLSRTYYYGSLNGSDYAFAYILRNTDKPTDK